MRVALALALLVKCLDVFCADEVRRELPEQKTWYAVSLPAGYNAKTKYEVFIAMQGSGDTPDNVVKFWRSVLRGRNCIIAAPKPADTRFWNFDESEKAKATLEDLKKTYSIDEKRVNLLGFSAGCAIGFKVIGAYPGTFRVFGGLAHVIHEEMTDDELNPAADKTAVFYSVGAADAKYIEKARKSAERLKTLKFDCSADFPEKVGHTCTLDQVRKLTAFIDGVYAKDAKAAAAQKDAKAPAAK